MSRKSWSLGRDAFLASRRRFLMSASAVGAGIALPVPRATAQSDEERLEVARRWVEEEFQPSTLSIEEQMEEMEFLIRAAEPYRGMDINVVSETLTTHEYESSVLARAFSEITGINITHNLIQEGDVVEALQTQMQSGRNVYDAYINDADLIGTHFRYGTTLPIDDLMQGEFKDITLSSLDLDDFMGAQFGRGPDGKLYQLPVQQFANLYWFRYDWFTRDDFREQFRNKFGYDLGVPVNWSAYEDIADFFTNDVGEIDGQRVWGHMDYGKKDPSLGWRFTDAWLAMAGACDKGFPNGLPVDEWGIRMEGYNPVGSSVTRGGATNSPAAVYSLQKYIDWLQAYAPPEAQGMTFSEAGPVPAQGNIAQQIFWYTAFTADMIREGLPVVDEDGLPKWRMAPSPYGAYWQEGMKLGYQDCGSWTFLDSTPAERRQAAWLYAQFTVAKTTSLKKTMVGLTPIRDSDIRHEAMTEMAPRLGGLVEFYRSPARVAWTDTGYNVPDYPRLAQLWWQYIGEAAAGEVTAQEAMDNLAEAQDQVMARIERSGIQGDLGPKLNEERDPEYWYEQPGAPWPKLEDEKPQGETVDYDQLLQAWREGRER